MPPMPGGCLDLWHAFQHMSAGHSAGMGVSGLAQSEIAAWQSNNGVVLTPWEIETILALDRVALKHLTEKPTPPKS